LKAFAPATGTISAVADHFIIGQDRVVSSLFRDQQGDGQGRACPLRMPAAGWRALICTRIRYWSSGQCNRNLHLLKPQAASGESVARKGGVS